MVMQLSRVRRALPTRYNPHLKQRVVPSTSFHSASQHRHFILLQTRASLQPKQELDIASQDQTRRFTSSGTARAEYNMSSDDPKAHNNADFQLSTVFDVKDKVALITGRLSWEMSISLSFTNIDRIGGGSGIGKSIATTASVQWGPDTNQTAERSNG
jgi:hypothetical protein